MAVDIFDRLSQALLPHREALQSTIEQYLCEIRDELKQANVRSSVGRPTMYDKWSTRPFEGTGASSPVEIVRTKLNEALLIQTLWFQAEHEAEAEAVPGFMLQINGIPQYPLAPSRILKGKELGIYAEKLGGDLIVPRGSVLELVPMFPAAGAKMTIKGAVTFVREVLTGTQDAIGGISEEQYGIWPSRQHETHRGLPDDPGDYIPGSDTIVEEYGGEISPDPIIADDQSAYPVQS